MTEVDRYIDTYTKTCSNELQFFSDDSYTKVKLYQPWLTPDNARRVAELAREEVITELQEWLGEAILEHLNAKGD